MATFGESENIHLTTLEFLWKQSPPGLAINSSSSTAGKMHPRSCSSSSGGSGNRRGRASLALRSYASAAANSQSLASGCRLELAEHFQLCMRRGDHDWRRLCCSDWRPDFRRLTGARG